MQNVGLRPSSRWIKTPLLMISLLAVSSCSHGPLAVVTVQCPPLQDYTPAQQKQAAKELRALPKGSQVGGLVSDYGTLRARCRAYQKD